MENKVASRTDVVEEVLVSQIEEALCRRRTQPVVAYASDKLQLERVESFATSVRQLPLGTLIGD